MDYLVAQGHPCPIRAEVALDWARQASARCYRTGAAKRLRLVRGFLSHLKAFEPETEIPLPGLVAEPRRPKAHLYSPEQITHMMAVTRLFWEADPLRQKTIYTVIGLLASSGLRIREALQLTLDQVHLDDVPPYLEIRNTKFHKSRLVPIHPTTAEKLREYQAERQRDRYAWRFNTFFISYHGRPLHYLMIRKALHQIQSHVGIAKTFKQQGPALHALRHAFAVERLLAWYRAGVDVRTQMPHLSVYLGHLGMVETYRYLSATPELLTVIGEIFGRYAQSGDRT
ncbi:MAG: tyrosine-type recombinase/integrase [Candidatus Solibacter sp.]|nr:tyrosine-type recombinase/integrase [Candidatus Solibacter sp.]